MTADKKYEDCKIKKQPSSQMLMEATLIWQRQNCRYYEGILNDTVSCDLIISNSGSTINGKNLLEGLPLVGTEDFELQIEDPKEIFLNQV